MTLHYLKAAPGYRVLALWYSLSMGAVWNTIHTTLALLHHILLHTVASAASHSIPRDSPDRFADFLPDGCFPNVDHVADTTLISIEQPQHHVFHSATYSNYMPGHKGKVLIDISPNGNVRFVSKVYGGQASDFDVAQASGFFDTIQRGESVMFDKGGEALRPELEKIGATLITPSFVVNGALSALESDHSRRVARARVIIENVNERVKRFRILTHRIPSKLFPKIDIIVAVCAWLTHFMGPLRNVASEVDATGAGAEHENEADANAAAEAADADVSE